MYLKGRKIVRFQFFHKTKIDYLEIMNEICFIIFFEILQFCGLLSTFWPLKSLVLNQGSQLGQIQVG